MFYKIGIKLFHEIGTPIFTNCFACVKIDDILVEVIILIGISLRLSGDILEKLLLVYRIIKVKIHSFKGETSGRLRSMT